MKHVPDVGRDSHGRRRGASGGGRGVDDVFVGRGRRVEEDLVLEGGVGRAGRARVHGDVGGQGARGGGGGVAGSGGGAGLGDAPRAGGLVGPAAGRPPAHDGGGEVREPVPRHLGDGLAPLAPRAGQLGGEGHVRRPGRAQHAIRRSGALQRDVAGVDHVHAAVLLRWRKGIANQ